MKTPALYRRLRAHGYGSAFAFRFAKLADRWDDAEADARVRIRFEPDDSPLFDSFDIPNTPAGERERERIEALAERAGWWFAVAEFRRTPRDPWQHADSLGGLLGYADASPGDPSEALPVEYRADMLSATLEALAEADAEAEALAEALETVERSTSTDTGREALAMLRRALADRLPFDPEDIDDDEPLRPFLAVAPQAPRARE